MTERELSREDLDLVERLVVAATSAQGFSYPSEPYVWTKAAEVVRARPAHLDPTAELVPLIVGRVGSRRYREDGTREDEASHESDAPLADPLPWGLKLAYLHALDSSARLVAYVAGAGASLPGREGYAVYTDKTRTVEKQERYERDVPVQGFGSTPDDAVEAAWRLATASGPEWRVEIAASRAGVVESWTPVRWDDASRSWVAAEGGKS